MILKYLFINYTSQLTIIDTSYLFKAKEKNMDVYCITKDGMAE